MKTFSSREIIIRLKKAMDIQSDNALAESLGISRGTLSNWKVRNSIDFGLVFSKCKQVSIDWLLSGEGEMLKSDKPLKTNQPTSTLENDNLPTITYNPERGAPYYNVDFLGGFDLAFEDQTVNPEYNIDFRPFNKRGVSWVNITGHSMEPKISHGDIIAIKECRLEDVQYGEIYAVVLDTLRVVKILRKSKDPSRMRYVSINENYDDQEYENSRILHIFEVLGNISRFM